MEGREPCRWDIGKASPGRADGVARVARIPHIPEEPKCNCTVCSLCEKGLLVEEFHPIPQHIVSVSIEDLDIDAPSLDLLHEVVAVSSLDSEIVIGPRPRNSSQAYHRSRSFSSFCWCRAIIALYSRRFLLNACLLPTHPRAVSQAKPSFRSSRLVGASVQTSLAPFHSIW